MASGEVEVTGTEGYHLSGCAPPRATEKHSETLNVDEFEDLILAAIKKVQNIGKRADFESVPVYLEKHHGLARTATFQQLESMIANNKISNINYRGKPSLRLLKDSGLSEKERKLSNDEERLSECREELQEMASRHCSSSKETSNEGNDEEIGNSESEASTSSGESADGSEDEYEECTVEPIIKHKVLTEKKIKKIDEIQLVRRLELIEKKVNEFEGRLNSKRNENENEKPEMNDKEKLTDLQNRMTMLEKENRILQDENFGLRLENLELRSMFTDGLNAKQDKDTASIQLSQFHSNSDFNLKEKSKRKVELTGNSLQSRLQPDENVWTFPKTSAKIQKPVSKSFLTKNRYSMLNNLEEESEKTRDSKTFNFGEKKESKKSNFQEKTVPRVISSRNAIITVDDDKEQVHGLEKVDRTMEPGDFSYADSVRIQEWSKPTNSITRSQTDNTRSSGATEREFSAVRPQFHRGRDNPPFRSEGRKPRICITGDSMIKRIRRQDMNREISGVNLYLKSFPGATVDHMRHYIEPTISTNPDGIILHCGTNNLRNEEPVDIANKIIDLAMTSKRRVRDVAISSLVIRSDSEELDAKRQKVNAILERALRDLPLHFINHDNIEEKHLDKWGLHLNFSGTNMMAGNFIDFLNET